MEGVEEEVNVQANVSSILTHSLALVSMNPAPLPLAHSSPVLAGTSLSSFRSHLFPATIFTGSRAPASFRVSSSMEIRSAKCARLESEADEVIS